jgi:hypothetical protein
MFDGRSAQDPIPSTAAGWIDTFYSADNLQTKDTIQDSVNGFSGTAPDDVAYSQRFGYLKNGNWVAGNGLAWCVDNVPSSWESLIYPAPTLPISDELGTDQVAFTSAVNLQGTTPVPNRVA